jgi:hypothetical protein
VTADIECPHPFYRASRHAAERAREMDVDWVEVLRVVLDPEVSYDDNRRGRDNRVAQRGDLAVVYDSETGSVITVLERKVEPWERPKPRA